MSKKRLLVAFLVTVPPMAAYTWIGWNTNGIDWLDDAVAVTALVLLALWFVAMYISGSRSNVGAVEGAFPRSWKLGLRRVSGTLAAYFMPDIGTCRRCYTPWSLCKRHVTAVDELFGDAEQEIWVMCEWCWRDALPRNRICYYGYWVCDLLPLGITNPHDEWPKIVEAVNRQNAEYAMELSAAFQADDTTPPIHHG